MGTEQSQHRCSGEVASSKPLSHSLGVPTCGCLRVEPTLPAPACGNTSPEEPTGLRLRKGSRGGRRSPHLWPSSLFGEPNAGLGCWNQSAGPSAGVRGQGMTQAWAPLYKLGRTLGFTEGPACEVSAGSEGVVGPGGSRGGAVTENWPPPRGSWLGAAWTLEVNSFSDGDPARVSQ